VPATEARLAIDASVAIRACLGASGFELLTPHGQLVAPQLLWSEVTSALRELAWRHEIDAATARSALERLLAGPVEAIAHPQLHHTATALAGRLGWAKTYDAEYIALAQLLDVRLVTVDARLARGAGKEARIVGPMDLQG
jgi:predicted nucleic acid-binding protein